MNHPINTILGDTKTFIEELISEVEQAGFDLDDFTQLDHICFRTTSLEEYRKMQQQLEPFGQLLTETEVNGRPISTYHLHEPITVGRWVVPAIELPAPKPGRQEVAGLEHGELVLLNPLKDFMKKYAPQPFDTKAADRGINPEVGLKFPSGKGVKFHMLSLTAVTQLEQLLGVTSVEDGKSGV